MADGMSLAQIDAQLIRDRAELDLMRHQRDALMYGQAAMQLPRRVGDPAPQRVWFDEAKDIDSATYQSMYDRMMQTWLQNPPAPTVVNKPLDEIDNATLVMEMLKRGYAVMKLPDDGGPPEALRGTTDSQ